MMLLIEYRVTTNMLWQGAIAFALIDILFVTLLVKRLSGEMLRQIRPFLLITSGVFWFVVWILMSIFFWEPVYHHVFPAWARWVIPPVYAVVFILVAFVLWWLSLHLPGHPTLNFCILGGLWGMVTHLWGISRGLIDKPPMLQGLSPLSVAVMPIFEFIFYWCIILSISLFVYRHSRRSREANG